MQDLGSRLKGLQVRRALALAAEALSGVGGHPKRDAELLLRHASGQSRAWLLAHPEAELAEQTIGRFSAFLERRLEHEPIQYIVGEQEFYGLPLWVTTAVLIPRPETEHLVEAVLARLQRDRSLRIADVGTGSGAIALALAAHLPHAQIDALDLSTEALAVAESNARRLGFGERVRCFQSDLLANAPAARYDCIASNPPYIAEGEPLESQVALWEPHSALFAGPEGLETYRRLLPQAALRLAPGGLLALEVGAGQADAVALLASEALWSAPEIIPDLQAIARVLCLVRSRSN